MSSDPALLILLAHARTLAPLGDWPPLGALLEEIRSLPAGCGSISERDAQRLQTWARRWSALHPDLQGFYAAHADHQATSGALWAILDGRRPPQGPAYGRLSRLWTTHHGTRGSLVLVPRIP